MRHRLDDPTKIKTECAEQSRADSLFGRLPPIRSNQDRAERLEQGRLAAEECEGQAGVDPTQLVRLLENDAPLASIDILGVCVGAEIDHGVPPV